MVVLSIVLQYVTPNVSVSSFFGGFSTDIWSLPRFLNNFFLLFANIWFWLYFLLLFTYLLILGLLLQFSFWGILLFAVIGLLLLCIFFFIRCFFLETFWVSPFCTMSVIIDRSAVMSLIWFSILVFLLVLTVYCFFSLGFLAFYPSFQILRTHSHFVADWCHWGWVPLLLLPVKLLGLLLQLSFYAHCYLG